MTLEITFTCSQCLKKHNEEVYKGNYSTDYSWTSLTKAVKHCQEHPSHEITARSAISSSTEETELHL